LNVKASDEAAPDETYTQSIPRSHKQDPLPESALILEDIETEQRGKGNENFELRI